MVRHHSRSLRLRTEGQRKNIHLSDPKEEGGVWEDKGNGATQKTDGKFDG